MFAFLARLILFAIAISVIRSVVSFVQRALSGVRSGSPTVRSPGRSAGPATETTMLQQDPVCGTYVAIDTSLKKVVNGKVLHFCSAECREKYST
jgi:YHS domain-containing protein